jgi:hypothetical protein
VSKQDIMNIASIFSGLVTASLCLSLTVSFGQDGGLVAVNRWYSPEDQQYRDVADGEPFNFESHRSRWTDSTFLFYAYNTPGPGRVAVNSWFNPVSRSYMSVCEDEYTDEQMMKNGYRQKHLQFYGLTKKSDKTVCVYRWLLLKRHCWVTIPDNNDTDIYLKKGYHDKTYQFYGLAKK